MKLASVEQAVRSSSSPSCRVPCVLLGGCSRAPTPWMVHRPTASLALCKEGEGRRTRQPLPSDRPTNACSAQWNARSPVHAITPAWRKHQPTCAAPASASLAPSTTPCDRRAVGASSANGCRQARCPVCGTATSLSQCTAHSGGVHKCRLRPPPGPRPRPRFRRPPCLLWGGGRGLVTPHPHPAAATADHGRVSACKDRGADGGCPVAWLGKAWQLSQQAQLLPRLQVRRHNVLACLRCQARASHPPPCPAPGCLQGNGSRAERHATQQRRQEDCRHGGGQGLFACSIHHLQSVSLEPTCPGQACGLGGDRLHAPRTRAMEGAACKRAGVHAGWFRRGHNAPCCRAVQPVLQ